MNTLLTPEARPAEEAVKEHSSALPESIVDLPTAPPSDAIAVGADHLSRQDLLCAAERVAGDLARAEGFHERLVVYKEVGRGHRREARRVLNLAAIRWPETITWINDLPEWKALLAADLS